MAAISSPVKDFTGVVVGVSFVNGEAETDNESALAYFRRQGYKVEQTEPEPQLHTLDGAPAGNASNDEWAAFATANGYTEEELAGKTRGDIRVLPIKD